MSDLVRSADPTPIEVSQRHLYAVAAGLCRGGDVIEIGCGNGAGTRLLSAGARSAIGIESDEAALAAAREGGGARFEHGDPCAVPLPDGCADLLLCLGPLPEDGDPFLAQLHRLLRSGGVVMLAGSETVLQQVPHYFEHTTFFARQPASALVRIEGGGPVELTGPVGGPDRVVLGSDRALPTLGSSVLLDVAAARPPFVEGSTGLGQVRRLRTQVLSSYAEARTASRVALELRQELGRVNDRLIQASNGERQAIAAVGEAVAAMQQARAELDVMRASTVWRATEPVRRVGSILARLRRPPPEPTPPAAVAPPAELPTAPEAVASLSPYTEKLRLRLSNTPTVSVVIVAHDRPRMTLRCLLSLGATPPSVPIEVILVDDAAAATEELEALWAQAEAAGIRLLRNRAGLGFRRSCNEAAALARGDHLFLLTDRAELRPGALDALVDLLGVRTEAGMAGAKLIDPDGTLRMAGGIVWDDATTQRYGCGQDAARPEFNYVREVDYCFGGALLVRRALFMRLGGFEAFAPACDGDVDLALRARGAGYKVLYEPRSVVVQHEDVSNATEQHPAEQGRLRDRWHDLLLRDQFPPGTASLRARDRGRHRKVALAIDHNVLEPDRDAGSRSMLGIVQSLLDAGWIVKYWPQNQAYSPIYTPMMEDAGVEVIDQRGADPLENWLRENGPALDHVLIARPEVAADVAGLVMRFTDAVLSFYGHDLHCARMRRQAELEGDDALRAKADTMERLERRVWRLFDVVLYPSEEEAAAVRAMAPEVNALRIVPFTFDADAARTAAPPGQVLLFVAGFAHPPNVDAALFLVREVMPLLQADIGPIPLILAGSNPTAAVQALAGPTVEVTGFIADEELAALYRRARAAVVPIRFGAGVKGKVIETLSRGLPVVTTSVGAQGIDGLRDIVPVHDDPVAIASALANIMRDDASWLAQSAAQTAFASHCFSREAMRRSVLGALGSVDPSLVAE